MQNMARWLQGAVNTQNMARGHRGEGGGGLHKRRTWLESTGGCTNAEHG